MGFSTFQIERLLNRFWRGRPGEAGGVEASRVEARGAGLPDRLELSEEAQGLAHAQRAQKPQTVAPPALAVTAVADHSPLPEPVEAEQDRRAGRFMIPSPPPAKVKAIPKTRRPAAPPPAANRAEG